MSNDRLALIKAINLNPLEDTPRLMLADYLDDLAESPTMIQQAELIRVQCRIHNFNSLHISRKTHWYNYDRRRDTREPLENGHYHCLPSCAACQHENDITRERYLLGQLVSGKISYRRGIPILEVKISSIGSRAPAPQSGMTLSLSDMSNRGPWSFLPSWLISAKESVRETGASFTIVDRKPHDVASRLSHKWIWYGTDSITTPDHSRIPHVIWDRLSQRDYRTEQEAIDDLNTTFTIMIVEQTY